ncbi:MAG: hypothetical protein IIU32_01120 [Firmicutes bacterium]|nr:hypothetical protein [Bacillota bacterium]
MVPELEKVLNTIGTSYDRSLKKRYPQPPAPQAPNVPELEGVSTAVSKTLRRPSGPKPTGSWTSSGP